MSHKGLAIGTLLILVSVIAVGTLFVASSILQAINPVAAVTALAVALVGFVWFKKTSRYE